MPTTTFGTRARPGKYVQVNGSFRSAISSTSTSNKPIARLTTPWTSPGQGPHSAAAVAAAPAATGTTTARSIASLTPFSAAVPFSWLRHSDGPVGLGLDRDGEARAHSDEQQEHQDERRRQHGHGGLREAGQTAHEDQWQETGDNQCERDASIQCQQHAVSAASRERPDGELPYRSCLWPGRQPTDRQAPAAQCPPA